MLIQNIFWGGRKRWYWLAGIIMVLSITGWLMRPWNAPRVPLAVEFDGKKFTLEGAVTQAEQEKGLGGRESLCRECGMVFVFERSGRHAFWMQGMHFPLDIIWLYRDQVVFIAREVRPDSSGILDPAVSADRVIELNAAEASPLTAGERVRFSY